MSDTPTSTQTVLHFDGKDGHVDFGAMNVDFSQGLTLELWVRFERFRYWSRVLDFGNGDKKNNIQFFNVGGSKQLQLLIYRGSSGKSTTVKTLEKGTWQHLAATIDAADHAVIYNGGQAVKEGTVWLPANVNRRGCFLGKSNTNDDRYFHGEMAEVRLWNRTRSAEEIAQSMSQRLSGSEPGLVAYWPLDDGEGEEARDEAAAAQHGTLRGGVTWTTSEIALSQPRTPSHATGLEDFGYWWRWKQSLSAAADPEQPFRRGRIWA